MPSPSFLFSPLLLHSLTKPREWGWQKSYTVSMCLGDSLFPWGTRSVLPSDKYQNPPLKCYPWMSSHSSVFPEAVGGGHCHRRWNWGWRKDLRKDQLSQTAQPPAEIWWRTNKLPFGSLNHLLHTHVVMATLPVAWCLMLHSLVVGSPFTTSTTALLTWASRCCTVVPVAWARK